MAKAAKATEKAPPTGTHEKGTSVRPPATSAFFGYLSMLALALQFGLQPVLNRAFAGEVRSNAVMVIMCEGCKFILAALAIAVKLRTNPRLLSSWNLVDSLKFSGLPACTYAVQNVLIQLSMRFLSPLEFNLINQSKLIWTAVFVYVLLHRRFSIIQCVAMALLMAASLLLSSGGDSGKNLRDVSPTDHFYSGYVPVLMASVLSGFGAALTQLSLQTHARDASVVTAELCVYGALFLIGNILLQPSASLSFDGWTMHTFIPVVSSATGGLLVGAVTQFAGGVMKSYSLIGGIALTGVLEAFMYQRALSNDLYIASGLVVASMYLYSSYPYVEHGPAKPKQQ
ncbi:hypothetical protein H310_03700 [Aphanomyces invadans]|uniref:UDP-galactose transporter n=1 Tax=Aphanomyces invadans TaxID=157072 RepID=A0A024UJR1_9STRA|nr:hypothetical protein H310_03700 [Aphanomyces invadans]ETW06107.1 hypothetical protein H310_03700 [Aphanomyces invadans]|eukprot:XP_008865884.1 hypothetical protein H310_03700 [Aphanomyces invadans]